MLRSGDWRPARMVPAASAAGRFRRRGWKPCPRRPSACSARAARFFDGGSPRMTIESVAAELRPLRARIHAQRANRHTWPTKEEELEADCDRYDRRLLKAATMLGLEAPAGLGREQALLTDEQREQIERR